MKKLCFALPAFLMIALSTFAQNAASPANPISASERGFYGLVSGLVVAAAQKMPEENYSFKPTPDVRSYGQLVGHVADAQYGFCASATGDTPPMKDVEKTKVTKADLVAALKEAVAYCNKAYAGMTDAEGGKMTKFQGYPLAKLTVLSINTAHTDEHYGNMVTYLRLKGLVPPSSEKPPSGSGQQ